MAEDKDKEQERADLEKEEANLQNQKASLEKQNRSLQEKIEALERARKNVGEAKDAMKKQMKYLKKLPSDHLKGWEGNTFLSAKESLEKGTLHNAYDSYIKEVDQVEDNLNNEIARLKSQVWENEGLIGKIKTALNNVWTKLKNLCN